MPPKPCLQAALDYLARGWSPIPLCPADHQGIAGQHQTSCKSPGKAPLWPWKEYQTRLPRPAEMHLYWTKCPASNVGLAMGPVSGLIGLDIDGEEGAKLFDSIAPDNIRAVITPPT